MWRNAYKVNFVFKVFAKQPFCTSNSLRSWLENIFSLLKEWQKIYNDFGRRQQVAEADIKVSYAQL